MPLLVEEAAKLSIEDRERGVIEEIIDRDELFALLPFKAVADETYSYVREGELPGGAFLDAYEALEESAPTYKSVSTKVRRFGGQIMVDEFMRTVQSSLNDQTALAIAAKAKGMGRDFRNAIVNSANATNPKAFDGLRALVTAEQTLTAGANGAAVSFSALDELKDAVARGADCLMMRQGTWRAIRALNRAAGGNTADMMMIENFGHPVKAYDGTPVIINDFIEATETTGSSQATTSIYALRLNEVDGLHGIYSGTRAGLELVDLGLSQTKDAHIWRLKWYAGLALKSTVSVARLKGITNV